MDADIRVLPLRGFWERGADVEQLRATQTIVDGNLRDVLKMDISVGTGTRKYR